jgi:hypothetical protein
MTRSRVSRKPVTGRGSATEAMNRAEPACAELAGLHDSALLDAIQRQTFRYFWDGAHPVSGLAADRLTPPGEAIDHKMSSGGSGFGVMALIVAVERKWVTREAALERLERMLEMLARARTYHGSYPHFLNGSNGDTIPFWRKDDAGDLVETSLLIQGLLCARQYFRRKTPREDLIRQRITMIWEDVEWNWFTRDGRPTLFWHWSPYNGWSMNHEIQGYNECLITYVLAASSPRYAIDPQVYHSGFANGRGFINGRSYYDIALPLGMPYGGPLFITHYSFCGLDPRGLKDRYADYWQQNTRHVAINRAHCIANPGKFRGYGASCWGLTASEGPKGYNAHAPDRDDGTIAPTAALASMPYAPREALQVARHLLGTYGNKVWGPYGFVDAFNPGRNWHADMFLAVDQGPIVVMIENHRTGLLWKLFMSIPEVRTGLRKLDFQSPHLDSA